MPQEPTLIGASVFFHTNDEDKDGDTYVSVTVRQRDNIIVARIDDNFGGFPDHSDHGPFGMQVTNASPKSEVQSGNVTIRIDPNGNDTWRFNFITTLLFDDASRLVAQADGLELTQDRQQQTFGISAP